MMKRIVLCLLFIAICVSASFAGYDDGYITAGEYEYAVEIFGDNTLIVEGGGADGIEMRDYSYLEVRNTSVPLSNSSGIWDIFIDDYSELLYLDGITEEISVYDHAIATLKGGRIDYLRSMQHVSTVGNITIESQLGWSWIEDGSDITGITGLWANDDAFTINFFDDGTGYYDPTWENINVAIVPEPATLILFGIGGLMLRRKK